MAEYYVEDVVTGLIDGFYSDKDTAEDQTKWNVRTKGREFVCKQVAGDADQNRLMSLFWNEQY
jgi:hypothetical protein